MPKPPAKPKPAAFPRTRLRVYLAGDVMLGPGEAYLLQGIH